MNKNIIKGVIKIDKTKFRKLSKIDQMKVINEQLEILKKDLEKALYG